MTSATSKTPKSTFSLQNTYFRFKFFFDQNLDFVLGTFHENGYVFTIGPCGKDEYIARSIGKDRRHGEKMWNDSKIVHVEKK